MIAIVERRRRQRQRGWSVVEAVVVVLLMGFMAAGLWKMMGLIEQNRGGDRSRDVVQRAEDALNGLLLRDHGLPMPDGAVPSPNQPGHLEGWLPVGVLGTEPPGRIRYLVDPALVGPPTTLYRTDPMGLLREGDLVPRMAINGLDTCLRLIQREQAGVAAAAGLRVAFGVQTRSLAGSADPSANVFVLGPPSASASASTAPVRSRITGYTELVHRLGCFPAFARLATEVKATVLAQDLQDQAELNTELHELLVLATQESIVNAIWRIVNSAVRLAVSTWNTAMALVTTATTPMGLATAIGTLAAFVVEATTWAMLLEFSAESLEANRAALPLAEQARDAAVAYAAQLGPQRTWHLNRVNDFQSKGVMP